MLKLDRNKIDDALYIGIDINLTGNALVTMTAKQVRMRWIPVPVQGMTLDNMVFIWCQVAENTWGKIEPATKDHIPIYAVIEDPTGMERKAWQAAAMINKMIGMLSIIFYDNNIKMYFPSSVIWKKETVGNGKAEKMEIQKAMFKLIYPNVPTSQTRQEPKIDKIENHHIADAVALAYYGYILHQKDKETEDGSENHNN